MQDWKQLQRNSTNIVDKAVNIRTFENYNENRELPHNKQKANQMLGMFKHINNIMPKTRQAFLFADIMELAYNKNILSVILYKYIEENILEDEYNSFLEICLEDMSEPVQIEDIKLDIQYLISFLENKKEGENYE